MRVFTLISAQDLADHAGVFLTIDAGHTVRAHATFICQELMAHYVMTVKQNTPALRAELDALDWASVPVQHATGEKGHGRRERRTIQVMNAPGHITARFPHVRQVALVERYVTRTVRVKRGRRWVRKQVKSAVAVFIITSLDAREAAPAHLAGRRQSRPPRPAERQPCLRSGRRRAAALADNRGTWLGRRPGCIIRCRQPINQTGRCLPELVTNARPGYAWAEIACVLAMAVSIPSGSGPRYGQIPDPTSSQCCSQISAAR